ncbi:deoxyribodipyrimidine photo-lyase [Halomonas dongshanensis]|uniref:Deoxyribodipyrimidine photo-lyase n=1 Tax=Halomonas dongshanensis TaxID=2890835 RepID=A0ABT2EFC4_9GAMM|nr:deoxyribodipyrimidine photo-lyase [Halomonas dongshanensis]MCS2610287.1 deoxyribodipyrimidine photo-lyase [Halomonas dongshanensis]
MARQLVWLRSDLRVHDNSALEAAAAKGPVIAVFLRSVPQWQAHGHGANKITFWQRGVAAVKEALEGLNVPLLHRDIDHYDQAPKALLEIARQHDIATLHFNYEYPLNERRRDDAVIAAFKNAELGIHGHHDEIAFAPGTLLTGKEEYYSVFTPFAKAWHSRLEAHHLALRDTPKAQRKLTLKSDPLPALPDLDAEPIDGRQWPAGEDAAGDALERFLRFRARHYQKQRDFPALRGTSELSAYLSLGMISHRQCLQAILHDNGGHLGDGDAGLTTWANELIWREFYRHVSFGFPEVCRHEPFKASTQKLKWRDDETGFKAWCEGRTGYPLVDAAMRQLVATGWMHNRLRMVVAMFLSKHLLIDWRRGEAFFMAHLIDGDFCSNNGGWQWAASTGTDAAPYFRIFNPTTQSRRFDPEGGFIAQWLPELAELPAKARHAPPRDMLTQLDYPAPIVDHKAARQRALDAFKAL